MKYYTFSVLTAQDPFGEKRYHRREPELSRETAPALLFFSEEGDLSWEEVLPAVREYYAGTDFRTLQYLRCKIKGYMRVIVSAALRLPHPKDVDTLDAGGGVVWVKDFQSLTPTYVQVPKRPLYADCASLERLTYGCPCPAAQKAQPFGSPLISICSAERTLPRLPDALAGITTEAGFSVGLWRADDRRPAQLEGFTYVTPKVLADEPFGRALYYPESYFYRGVAARIEATSEAAKSAAVSREKIKKNCAACAFARHTSKYLGGDFHARPCAPHIVSRCESAKTEDQVRAAIDAKIAPFDVRKIPETTDFTKEQVDLLIHAGDAVFTGRHDAFGCRATTLRCGYFTLYPGMPWRFRVFATKGDVSRYHDFSSAESLWAVMPAAERPRILAPRTVEEWEYDAYSLLIQKRHASYAVRNGYSYKASLQMIYWGGYEMRARYGTKKAVGTRAMHAITSSTSLKRLYEIAYGENQYDRADSL